MVTHSQMKEMQTSMITKMKMMIVIAKMMKINLTQIPSQST